MKISTYFTIEEFVPKSVIDDKQRNPIWFVDRRIVLLADFIRGRFNKSMTINNWNDGGLLQNRGYRLPDSTVGGYQSQHKSGRAIDFNIDSFTPQEIYKDIIDNEDVYLKAGLTAVEDIAFTNKWTHVDCRYTGLDKLLIVKPL